MVLIYGEPTVGNGYSTHEISWEQCYSMCYWDANCSLSYYYSSECKLYQYDNYSVKQLTSSNEKMVAVKRNFTTNICPANPLAGTYSFEDNGTLHKTKITSDGTFWNITYSISFLCDSCGTKLFRRDNYWICVGVKHFPGCGTYSDAVKLCKEDGWESITGPYSVEEFQYFISNRPSTYDYWVDGEQKTFQDQTHNGVLNYPKCNSFGQAYCYYIPQSYNCITSGYCDYCWHGATCLKKIIDFS